MTRLLLTVLMLWALATNTEAASSDDLARRAVERRAVEAVIWGMPAVNTDLMLQEMLRKTTAKTNEIVYWSRPVNWKNQTLTPNPDAIYLMSFWNVKDGPIVIGIPPAEGGSIAGNIVNVWQMPLEDAGPEGADKGKGGKYLILPPGHQGTPPDGHIVLQSDTFTGFALLRSNLPSHGDADIARSVAYGQRVKIYPLAQAANPPATNFSDAYDTLFDSTIRYDASFFDNLDRVVQNEPWLDRDRAMIDQLRTLGIEKANPSSPTPRPRACSIRQRAKRAPSSRNAMTTAFRSSMKVSVGFPPPCRKWSRVRKADIRIPTPIRLMRAASPTRSASPASNASARRNSTC